MNPLNIECLKCGHLFAALPGTKYCVACFHNLTKDNIIPASPYKNQTDASPTSTKPLVTLTDKQIKLIEHARMFGGEVLGVTVHIKFPINSCTISPDGKTNWIKE